MLQKGIGKMKILLFFSESGTLGQIVYLKIPS